MYTATSYFSNPDFQLRHGHDGLVLCLDWSAATGRIVSGGEDCKYRVGRIFLCFGFIAYLQIQSGQNRIFLLSVSLVYLPGLAV